MARRARQRSPNGIYHVMTRGINKMDIFLDDWDRLKYYDILKVVKEGYEYDLYSYCLMTNHTHLLIKETESLLHEVMKSVGIRYSMYFNKKYARIGSLFQDRFRSEVINTENRFMTCARYIHNNPVKAGIVSQPQNYRWSSFRGYVGLTTDDVLDKDFLLGLHQDSSRELIRFTLAANDDRFLEYDQPDIAPEEDPVLQAVCSLVRDKFGLELQDVKRLERYKRREVISAIKASCDCSHRKLAKLLGISKDTIRRI